MFGIGQFAQIAKVSVRTLRHYDEVGLLRPAAVDASSGYRSYAAKQLPLLNRILVLKDLGFSLAEITRMTEGGISNEELVGMLRLRRAEAEREAKAERQRLSRVAARITLLQGDSTMSDIDTAIVVKALDAQHVVVASEPAESFEEDLGPIFERLYGRIFGELGRLGIITGGPTLSFYEDRSDGKIEVFAAVPVPADSIVESSEVELRMIPATERAVTLVHTGSMATVGASHQLLFEWAEATGEQPSGYSREVYLDCDDDQSTWVTELQLALA